MLCQQVTDEENYTFMTTMLRLKKKYTCFAFHEIMFNFRYANKEDQLIQGYTI